MDRSTRMTWIDLQGRTWRIELIGARWLASTGIAASDTWQRVGSYPTRNAAIDAAYTEENGTSTSR